VQSAHQIHKNDGISIYVAVLGHFLNFLACPGLRVWSPPHAHNCNESRVWPVSGQVREVAGNFSEGFRNTPHCATRNARDVYGYMSTREGTTLRRVLLADDHSVFIEALAKLLSSRYEVVGLVDNGRALREFSRMLHPDVIVTDITMPLLNGLEAVRTIRKDVRPPKIVFLSMHGDPDLARECFKCGGSAFVTKECSYEELIVAIETVLKNHMYLSPSIANDVLEVMRNQTTGLSEYDQLTQRQREILQLFAEGKTTKEIGSVMNLSTRTVEWHKYRMMRILRVQHSAELLRYAVRLKLVI
jgi:DNA-binding NarL/FixJ family response regulator